MILNQIKQLTKTFNLTTIANVRDYSFKTIKRPDFSSTSSKHFVEKKLKDFNLQQIFRARIEMSGPLTGKRMKLFNDNYNNIAFIYFLVASYMREVLTSPHSGYYMSRDVFGQQGDFITSPEITQIFGDLIAVWCLTEYQKIGSPQPLQIIELGPGRGTLIQDILRVCAQFQVTDHLSIHLVELSPYLSKLQARTLCYSSAETQNLPYYRMGETLSGSKVFWYHRIEDIPQEFSIILAHEFFDALPIHKLQRDGEIWKEILIDLDPADKEKFRFVMSRNETPISKLYATMRPDETRNHVEVSPELNLIAKHIAERLENHGGFGLIADYGHSGDKEDTFRVSIYIENTYFCNNQQLNYIVSVL